MKDTKTLVEIAEYYYRDKDYNCAEAVICAANDFYEMGLDTETLRIAAAFGGGMSTGNVCGAVSGAMMALGYLFVKERAHEGDGNIKVIGAAYMEQFESTHSTTNCLALKDLYHDEEAGCIAVVQKAATLLEAVVKEFSHLRVDA